MRARSMFLSCVVVAGVASLAHAAAFRSGKSIMETKYKVDVAVLRWGVAAGETDRVAGRIKMLRNEMPTGFGAVELVFDAYDLKGVVAKRVTVQLPIEGLDKSKQPVSACWRPEPYRVDWTHSPDVKTAEVDFCIEFARLAEIRRMHLVDVKVGGTAVDYVTKFNISADLLRSAMQVDRPKQGVMDAVATFKDVPPPPPAPAPEPKVGG